MPIVEQRLAGRQAATPAQPPDPPITPAELAAAIAPGFDATRAGHLLATVWALVYREAPQAPAAVQREAVIRMAGYLAQADFGAVRQETVGPLTVEHAPNHAAAFRNCGAKALLAPWRVRRAGVIG